ncbi:tripartite tricarboxylate transporter substrate binding protein [uncultured Peptoniphilus sp.]|uniref:tripartite tricarboxylate transporter substrate binding protein n=1 Tax=uncultured Peptoniphilus sp. TaxID=254354 RepID=UPI00260CEC6C|nr:tripartite tricarboxylate transporter substrate binding protein [uncultured Peptoniphilus sp.]
MKKKFSTILTLVALTCALLVGCSNDKGKDTASSEEGVNWPTDTVTVVVPYGAGGDTDTYARQMALQLQKELNQNFVVVNTTGAAGVVGASSVLDAKPDGNTMLFNHTGASLSQEAANANEFSFLDDFETVASVAEDDTYTLLAKKGSEWDSLDKMIAWAKENPGKLRYSSTYYGATHAVATQMEKTMGIELDKIDVGSSTSERLTSFIQDQCDIIVVNFMNVADYVEKGDFVVLGVCSDERLKGLEEFPTLKEQGYDVVMPKIYEVRFPKGTDQAIVDKLSESIKKVTESEEFKSTLEKYYAKSLYRDGKTSIEEDKLEVQRLKDLFGIK